MFLHPGLMILAVWSLAFVSYFILPFVLTWRSVQFEGLLVLFLFIFAFCFSAFLQSPILKKQIPKEQIYQNTKKADYILTIACIVAISMFMLDMISNSRGIGLDVISANRNDQAQALLHGGPSMSSIPFKIAFIFYPASYTYIVLTLLLSNQIKFVRLALFGILPGLLAAFVMGGRSPLLCTIFLIGTSWLLRPKFEAQDIKNCQPDLLIIPTYIKALSAICLLIALGYFIKVFLVRAETTEGASAIFRSVGIRWGVTFDGPVASAMVNLAGEKITYLVFVFSWYFNQGVLISNSIFTDFKGGSLFGIYGVDIFSAIARRLNPQWVTDHFEYLLNINIYGFFPSAFGTLFIDFGYFGLAVSAIWGGLSAFVYRKVQAGYDRRYRILYPFVVMGIVFSLINTPFGFGNGLITYFWLFLAFGLVKSVHSKTQIGSQPATVR